VIATSIVRDCYAGRRMASVISLAMMIFIAVPIVAPAFGQAVLLLAQWRGIFVVLMLYGVVTLIWSALRMPETLAPANRRSLAAGQVLDAFRQTVTNRQTLGYALVAGGVLGSLFAYIFIAQQVFTDIYQLGHYFPLAFAGVAVGTAIAGFVNSRLVGRLGMRVISHAALIGYVVIAAIMLAAAKLQMVPLPLFMVLSVMLMFAFGLMISNFTALAMEPQGHIAGTAASLYGSITTLLGISVGATIGQDFDGTLVPFATGFLLCTLAALAVVLVVEKGRLFQPHGSRCDGHGRCLRRRWRRLAKLVTIALKPSESGTGRWIIAVTSGVASTPSSRASSPWPTGSGRCPRSATPRRARPPNIWPSCAIRVFASPSRSQAFPPR
jgi:DHA1 family bicyclomycin/chloramphenicol resistance-like MFS transporter